LNSSRRRGKKKLPFQETLKAAFALFIKGRERGKDVPGRDSQ